MKIYLAGPYDGPDVVTILGNIRRGIEAAADLMRKGNEVYCPFLDFLIAFMPGPAIDKTIYQQNLLSFILAQRLGRVIRPGYHGPGDPLFLGGVG